MAQVRIESAYETPDGKLRVNASMPGAAWVDVDLPMLNRADLARAVLATPASRARPDLTGNVEIPDEDAAALRERASLVGTSATPLVEGRVENGVPVVVRIQQVAAEATEPVVESADAPATESETASSKSRRAK